MSNLKTLKPFGKGHDPRRNLRGRPKGKVSSFDEILERELKKNVLLANGTEVPMDVAIIMRLISDARKGKLYSTKLIFNYLYGKPVNYCPKCDYIATRSARKQLEEEMGREKAEQMRLEEEKRHLKNMKEAEEWMEGWFPKEPKKKRK